MCTVLNSNQTIENLETIGKSNAIADILRKCRLVEIKHYLNLMNGKTVIIESFNGIEQGTFIRDFAWYEMASIHGEKKLIFFSVFEEIMSVGLTVEYIESYVWNELSDRLTIELKNNVMIQFDVQ